MQTVFHSCRESIDRHCECRIDRNPGHRDCVLWKTEVVHYNREMGVQEIFRDQVRDNSGRHEMRADGDMRFELAYELHQGAGIEAVQHEAHTVGLPRYIAFLVPPTEEFRSGLDQTCVELRIKIAKQFVREIKRVAMHDLPNIRMFFKHLGERIASADM